MTMYTATNFMFPPKNSKWDYSLEIKGDYDVTTVSLLVIDENRDVKFYHRVCDVPYEDARQRTAAPTSGETNPTFTF